MEKQIEAMIENDIDAILLEEADRKALQEEYENHDCHMSEEDGCRTCEKYAGANNID